MNEPTLISMSTLLVLGAFSILAPFLTPRRYYFGLTVAPGFPESEAGRAIRRGYVSAVAIATALAAALVAALAAGGSGGGHASGSADGVRRLFSRS